MGTNTNLLRDTPSAIWAACATILLALAIVLHAIFPRYEYNMIGANGEAMMIYDKWANRFQLAVYDKDHQPTLTRIVYPF
jgi:hypothetical protein